MRLLELTLFFVSMLAGGTIIWFRSRIGSRARLLIISALVSLFLLHICIDRLRWIMLPVYAISLVVLIGYVRMGGSLPDSRKLSRLKSSLLSFLALIAGLLAWVFPSLLPLFQFAHPSGPYAVGVVDYTWQDAERIQANGEARQLNVRIWYPSDGQTSSPAPYIPDIESFLKAVQHQYGRWAKVLQDYRQIKLPADYAAPFHPNAGPAPVVVSLHGTLWGTRFTGTFQALELASHGYVVIALEHPGTAFISAYPNGNYTAFTHHFTDLPDDFNAHNAVSIPMLREQQEDVQFVLNSLLALSDSQPDSPVSGQVDSSRIAMIGHSFGGAAAASMLGNSAMIKAAVNLDGYLYGEYPDTPLDKPLLILNGGLYIKGMEETMTGLEAERALRDRLLSRSGEERTLPQAGHLSFTDVPLYSPLLAPLAPDIKEQHRLINEITLRFLQKHL